MDTKDLQIRKLKKQSVISIFLLALTVTIVGCAGLAPKPSQKSRIPQVRVLLFEGQEMDVVLSGDYSISSGENTNFPIPRNNRVTFQVLSNRNGIAVRINQDPVIHMAEKLDVRPRNAKAQFVLSGNRYGGGLRIYRSGMKLLAVNVVDLEEYVKGVVPFEIGNLDRKRLEALKAQAVAARTYAFLKLTQKKEGEQYDLAATDREQVYRGYREQAFWSDRAVEETSGEILVYDKKPILALYHSTCGGRTAFGHEVFGGEERPYLRGVADDFGFGEFCKSSPYHRWIESFSFDEIRQILFRAGFLDATSEDGGEVVDVRVLSRFPSGRAKEVGVFLRNTPDPVVLSGRQFRTAFSQDGHMIRSTLIRIAQYGPTGRPVGILVVGAGYGHGAGMCQWGAIGMAESGFKYFQILKHYYRNANLFKMY